MEKILEKIVLSAIAGLALSSTVGCSTVKDALMYNPDAHYNSLSTEEIEKLPVYKTEYHPRILIN